MSIAARGFGREAFVSRDFRSSPRAPAAAGNFAEPGFSFTSYFEIELIEDDPSFDEKATLRINPAPPQPRPLQLPKQFINLDGGRYEIHNQTVSHWIPSRTCSANFPCEAPLECLGGICQKGAPP